MDDDAAASTPSGANPPSTGSTPQTVAHGQGTSSGSAGASQGNPTPVSASTPNTSATTATTTTSGGPPSKAQPHSKRRRGLGIVTPNACTECRKKRAKCDGQEPCGRCKQQKDVECVYEVPVRRSKENLRTEIETLRHRQQSSDQVFAALIRPELWEDVLHRLRGGQTIEAISDWLGSSLPSARGSLAQFPRPNDPGMGSGPNIAPIAGFGAGSGGMASMGLGSVGTMSPLTVQHPQSSLRSEVRHDGTWGYPAGSERSNSHPDAMNWQSEGPPQSRVGIWDENLRPEQMAGSMPRFKGLEQVLSPLEGPDRKTPASTWTNVTNDDNLVEHLLALYFCWEYPTFASLSKEHFLRDFQDGRPRYCSSILVNALLALGCRFSTQPMTRANPNDPYSSGDHFFKETQRLLFQERDHHNLTTIQALGIMSIREASCGRDSESWYYAGQSVRLAIEMGLHRVHDQGDEDELAVQAATFWGAFALDHAWSLATGSLPQCSCFPHLPPKPAIIQDIEASLWVPYTDNGAPLQRSCEQPSNVRSVYKCFCELSELVHESLYILHSPGRPLTARDLLNIYTKYLNWYDRIPEVLRLGHNFTPAVLFAHMYYHFAILLLFRPLIKLRIIGSKVSPRDVCAQAADAMQGLLRSYAQLYTLQRTPSFVPYFVLTSSIMHLAIGAASTTLEPESSASERMEAVAQLDPKVQDSISQGIADLAEMAPCHHFAEQALNILRYLATKWKLNINMESGKGPPEDMDRLVKPYTSSLNFFAPNVREEDFLCDWGPGRGSSQRGEEGTVKTAADSLENPLFWPFPTQGRPMLPSGKELEQAGFALL